MSVQAVGLTITAGKSTFSSQLSFALAADESEVGLMDIDICGPSIPRMLGLMVGQIFFSFRVLHAANSL